MIGGGAGVIGGLQGEHWTDDLRLRTAREAGQGQAGYAGELRLPEVREQVFSTRNSAEVFDGETRPADTTDEGRSEQKGIV